MQPDKKKDTGKSDANDVHTPQPPQIINPSSAKELEEKKKSTDKKTAKKK